MKTSALIICMLSTALVTTLATSGMWLMSERLRPAPLPMVVQYLPPMSVMAAPIPAAAHAGASVVAPLVGTPAIAPASTPESALGLAATPTSTSTSTPAMAPVPEAPAENIPDTAETHPVTGADDPTATSAAVPVATAADPVNLVDPGTVHSDDYVPVSTTTSDGLEDSIYHDTYVSYFGFDEVQVRTIPWYGRHFHLNEEELLTICYIARAANVPFGPAISIYVHQCDGSLQALLGYYQLSPQIFLVIPGEDFRCPPSVLRPYEWLRRGAGESIQMSNREYLDLLALKLSTEYLHGFPDESFLAQPGLPLRYLAGHPVVHHGVTTGSPAGERTGSRQLGTPGGPMTSANRGNEAEAPSVIVGEDGVHRPFRSQGFISPGVIAPPQHLARPQLPGGFSATAPGSAAFH